MYQEIITANKALQFTDLFTIKIEKKNKIKTQNSQVVNQKHTKIK